jgi:signal transduction histidine kinase/CheY-like chemotaxis protein
MRNNHFLLYLLGIFISTIILIVFLQYNSNEHINNLVYGNESLINEFKIIGQTQKLQTDMLYIESEIHRAVIGEDSSYVEGIQNKERNAREGLLNLKNLVQTDSTKLLVRKLDSLIEEKLKFGNSVLDALITKGQSTAEELYKSRKGKNAMGEIVHVIELLNGPRQQYLTQLITEADKSGHRARVWGLVLAITAVLACIFTFWYITRRIRRQQQLFNQLNESEKKVREAGIMKENFMANMSHEIRTPMNAILGFTNLLQKQPLDEKSIGFVKSIQSSGENLLTIINDVLDFSKIEAGMMRIESNSFSLRGLLQSLETMFATRIQPKSLHLTVEVEKSIPDVLKGDAVRLTQIMVNLINNSVKFTNAGGIDISVTARKVNDEVFDISFSVKDTGIGISSDKINTIFERFQQADEDTTRKYGGTGLGLTIVKQLVELQNGTISVSSVQDVGTEFVFTIPYAIAKDIKEKNKVEPLTDSEIQSNENRLKILVAEDNAMNQSLMKHLLTDWHLAFHIVNNGKEAIEALKQNKYSLVLMDIQMPQMDGYTATQKIRNELNSNVPIIAMTAHAMAGEREKCLSFGMNEYISKPIREDELFKIINHLLRRNNGSKDSDKGGNGFELINLGYLEKLSDGNRVFEISMIEQFLQQTPGDLAAMETEFNTGNYGEVEQIAHNMKTSVSFMGLLDKLGNTLDYIEKNVVSQRENAILKEKIAEVKETCEKAFLEAEKYLKNASSLR